MKQRKVMFVMLVSIFVITATQSYLWSGEPGELVKTVILNESSLNNKIENIGSYIFQNNNLDSGIFYYSIVGKINIYSGKMICVN